jgi:hypothetical protein
MTLLEDRLAAAGDQLDALVDTRLERRVDDRPGLRGRTTPRWRPLLVAAATVTVVAAGLLWTVQRGPADTPVADELTNETTALGSVSSGCGIDERDLVVVASTTDSQGRFVEYRVADLPDAFEEQLRVSDGGRMTGWMGSCDTIPLSSAHPSGTWTDVGSETSSTSTEVYVHGKLTAGSGPHLVTLSTGDVVPVWPTADGWFLATLVIRPVDDVEVVSTSPDRSIDVDVPEPTTPVMDDDPIGTTVIPAVERPPLAIGETVMLGAAPNLEAAGFVVDVEVGRPATDVVAVLDQYLATGRVGAQVVLHLGTNGPVSAETWDEILRRLPPDEVEQVIVLTVTAPGRPWIESNNEIIRSLPERHPNVAWLDWAVFVQDNQVPGLAPDGIHLGTDAAKQWYANHVFDVIGRHDLVQPLPE